MIKRVKYKSNRFQPSTRLMSMSSTGKTKRLRGWVNDGMVAPSRWVFGCSVEQKKCYTIQRGEKKRRRWLAFEEADGGFLYSEQFIFVTR
jgi:hypothetical protein